MKPFYLFLYFLLVLGLLLGCPWDSSLSFWLLLHSTIDPSGNSTAAPRPQQLAGVTRWRPWESSSCRRVRCLRGASCPWPPEAVSSGRARLGTQLKEKHFLPFYKLKSNFPLLGRKNSRHSLSKLRSSLLTFCVPRLGHGNTSISIDNPRTHWMTHRGKVQSEWHGDQKIMGF